MEEYELIDSGMDWLGKIPLHWKIDRVKDVSNLRNEKTSDKSSELDYLELEDLSQWTGKILHRRNTLEVVSQVNVFHKGDVLFGKLRPYLAKYCYADFNGRCTGEILAIHPYRIYSRFLTYYIGSKHFINHCNNFSYGAKMPRINWNTQVGIFPAPIPPTKEEQKAIADYLDKACQNIDQTIALKKQQLEKLEAYRKSVIHEVVTKGLDKTVSMKYSNVDWLGEIPEHWKVIRLKFHVSKTNSGVTPKGGSQSYLESGIPLIRSQNVKSFGLDLSDVVFIHESTHEKMANSKVLLGDVLLNITGASLGRSATVCDIGEANVNQHVCIIRAYPWLLSEYLNYLLISEAGQAQIFSGFKGSGREGLNFEAIKSFVFPLPGENEQISLVKYLNDVCDKLNKTKSTLTKQIENLTEYRKSLIHECVTGKKRVYQGEIY